MIHGVFAEERGSALPVVAFALLVMVGSVGLSIDLGRGYIAKAKLQSSLDAAGLAAGATMSTASAATEARKYLDVNFNGGTVAASVTNLNVVTRSNGTIIDLSATATLPTTFMRLFGQQQMVVAARTEVTREITGLELSLVLDVTGSMDDPAADGVRKIDALKRAATDLVGILFGPAAIGRDLYVGVVPFSQAVNIGPTRASWLDRARHRALPWGAGPRAWRGCVEERPNGRDIDDTPPVGVGKFQSYFQVDSRGNRVTSNPNSGCPVALSAMTSRKQSILASIQQLSPNGFTHIGIGAAWGWRMLSPRWRGQWVGEMSASGLPRDYRARGSRKAVVIMTDGDNTMPTSGYTAYGRLSDNRLGRTTRLADAALDTKLQRVCAAMKANGILVYTIVFGTNVSQASKDLMRGCASEEEFFFDSPSSAVLSRAFQTIGDSLSNLRVSR